MRFPDKSGLIEYVQLMTEDKNPEAIVIGCQGRSGKGAIDCLKELNWDVTGWDKVDTQSGGPFPAILNYDLFVNCVLALGKMPPFINKELIEQNPHKLNMISDVSCDPDSDCNMVPLYKEATVVSSPVFNVQESKNPLGIVAIDNLPSILPRESSLDFSSQLFPFLLDLGESNIPVNKALAVFKDNLGKL
jgi:saccharopine dehydrogenase (NAD+, L-lysine-forming)